MHSYYCYLYHLINKLFLILPHKWIRVINNSILINLIYLVNGFVHWVYFLLIRMKKKRLRG